MKEFTPENPELIAARARRDKLRADAKALEVFHAEQRERAERAEKSLERAEQAWRAEDQAAEKALDTGAYVAITPHVARGEFRAKIAAELVDVRKRLGEDECDYATRVERRNTAHTKRELLQSAERAVAELEAQHANRELLASAPELTEALRGIGEQLKPAGAVTHAGVTVTRTVEGVVTFTVASTPAQPAPQQEDSAQVRLQRRIAAEEAARKSERLSRRMGAVQ